jgi:transposase
MEKDAIGSPRAEEHRYKPNLASRPPYNRKTRDEFECKHCGFALAADWNAAKNIRDRASVMMPDAGVVDAGGRTPEETHLQAHVL